MSVSQTWRLLTATMANPSGPSRICSASTGKSNAPWGPRGTSQPVAARTLRRSLAQALQLSEPAPGSGAPAAAGGPVHNTTLSPPTSRQDRAQPVQAPAAARQHKLHRHLLSPGYRRPLLRDQRTHRWWTRWPRLRMSRFAQVSTKAGTFVKSEIEPLPTICYHERLQHVCDAYAPTARMQCARRPGR